MASFSMQRRLVFARSFDLIVELAAGSVRLVTRMAGVLLLIFLVDYQAYRMPVAGRLVAWAAIAATLAYCVVKFLLAAFVAGRSDDALALRVEAAHPSLAGRLIASVQLVRTMDRWYKRGMALVVEALRKQTEAMARKLRFSVITPVSPLAKTVALMCCVGLVWWAMIAHENVACQAFASRMLFGGAKYPSRHKIINVIPGDSENPAHVTRGAPLDFAVKFASPCPDEAVFKVVDKRGRTTELEMKKGASNTFVYTMARVTEPFTYSMHGGDVSAEQDQQGEPYRVNVRLRPVMTMGLVLDYPTYTGLTSRKVSGGTANVIEGTRIQVNATTSKVIREIKLIYLSGPKAGTEAPMTITSARSATMNFGEPLWNGFRYTVHVKDTEGVTNFDSIDSPDNPPPVYTLRTTPDRRPKVAVLEPKAESVEIRDRSETVTRVRATDDFGIVSIALHWTLRKSDFEYLAEDEEEDEEFDLAGLPSMPSEENWEAESLYRVGAAEARTELVRNYKIASAALAARAGDSIVFFVEARDHTASTLLIPGLAGKKLPRGIGRSKTYTLVVIDEETFRKRLARLLADLNGDIVGLAGRYEGVHKDIPAPEVKERAAEITWEKAQKAEEAKDRKLAIRLCRQVLELVPGTDLAKQAKERIAALEAAMKEE